MNATEQLQEQLKMASIVEHLGHAIGKKIGTIATAQQTKKAVNYLDAKGVLDPKAALGQAVPTPTLEKKAEGSENVPKPEGLKAKMDGVSLGKDKDGFYVYTHRARSKSYPTAEAIPDAKIKFVESTG